jgi:cobalt-precorrin 5A hydrolase
MLEDGAAAGVRSSGFDSLPALVADLFHEFRAHVFVAAAGIAVRCIAPHLARKDADPAVLVLDQEGRFVISLLSGHLGGANALAREVAALIGAEAVITTATDTAGLPSLDLMARDAGLAIGNLEAVRRVNAALLEGGRVQVHDPRGRLGTDGDERFLPVRGPEDWDHEAPGVWVDWLATAPGRGELRLYPRVLHVGVGCRRGAPAGEIEALVRAALGARGLAPEAVAGLASIEAKRGEPGISEAAAALGVAVRYFSAEELDSVAGASPSETVRRHMGVGSVCEAAAILASGGGSLVVKKTKTERATCAVAASS